MAKRLTESQKKNIAESFVKGLDVKQIAESYNFSPQTIVKQIKNIIGEKRFKDLKAKNSSKIKVSIEASKSNNNLGQVSVETNSQSTRNETERIDTNEEFYVPNSFVEVIPLTDGVELNKQKDITSIPISDFELPEVVYILVDKKTELEPKMLKEFVDWRFMPQEDLERMTLEIFSDQKKAKQVCSRDQKLIKIPNSELLLITSKYLKAKGISRIIFKDSLLSI